MMGSLEPLAAVSLRRRSEERIARLHLWFLQNFGFEICLIIQPVIGLELQEVLEWEQSGDPAFYRSIERRRRSYQPPNGRVARVGFRQRETLKRLNG